MAAVVSESSSPITQVQQQPAQTNLQPQLLTRLQLDLRGERFVVDRETIMNLPESVLLCLFPNGLVLSRQSVALSENGEADEDEEIYGVDVRCTLFRKTFYVLILPGSLTQNVSLTFSAFSELHRMPSMAQRRHQACLLPSSISPTMLHPPNSDLHSHKTHFYPSKPLLY